MKRNIHIGLFLAALIALGSVVGCDGQGQRPANDAGDGLKRAIAQVHGVYTWRGDLDRWDYSAKTELEAVLSTGPAEQTVGVLIECLDDTSTSASVLDGKPVALGIVCYQGLSQMAYHEPTATSGDVAASWPGFISPKASHDEMRSAKVAWKKAQEAKLLILQ